MTSDEKPEMPDGPAAGSAAPAEPAVGAAGPEAEPAAPVDPDILAAEYVLGTLEADERARVAAAIDRDPALAAMVRAWERRLGELHAMVDEVEPPPEIWQRIRFGLGAGERREPLRLPALPGRPPDPAEMYELGRRLGRWRRLAGGLAALAGLLAVVILAAALGVLPLARAPADRAADVARPEPAARPNEAATPEPAKPEEAAKAAALGGRFVAVLQKDAAPPAFIVTVDPATGRLTVRRVAAELPEGRSYELWLVSDRLAQPQPLGVLGAQEFVTGTTLAGVDAATIRDATLAISLEPDGGSPTGTPTGPLLFSGKLIESLPAD